MSLQQLPKIGGHHGPTYPVYAEFSQRLNLPANAEVHEGAQVIGQVGTIKVDNFHAEVELKIKNGYPAAGRDDRRGPLRQPARRGVRAAPAAADPATRRT